MSTAIFDLSGRVAIVNGRFVNAQTGAILDKINMQLVGAGSRINIVNGTATDGGRGRVRVSGHIDVSSGRGYPVDIRLETDRAMVLRLDDARMTVTSRLRVNGAVLRQLAVGGTVNA